MGNGIVGRTPPSKSFVAAKTGNLEFLPLNQKAIPVSVDALIPER
jgi:hypothetical protein